jgi:hypothetical protein
MPHEMSGRLTAKADLPDTAFAFPKQRKGPITNAKHYDVALSEVVWGHLGLHPQTNRKEAAAQGARTDRIG